MKSRGTKRGGFTLLEILLALGLMLLLVTAISQAISTYVNLSTLGREEVQQAQLGRAVLAQMTKDIRSLVFTPIPEEEMSLDDLGGPEAAGEDGGFESDAAEADTAGPLPTGIIGTSNTLIIYARQPDRRGEYVARDEMLSPSERVSDQRLFQYFLAESGGDGVSGEFAREALGPGVVKDIVGLARMDGDQTALATAMAANELDPQVECCSLLAREVIALEFAYYSGGEWLEEWDSTTENKLPQAIEIKISVQLQPEEDRSRFERVDESEEIERKIREYRRVVHLPLVPPVELEDEEEL